MLSQIPLAAIKSVRAMPEDDMPASAADPGVEHYYLVITTVRPQEDPFFSFTKPASLTMCHLL
jgi:hypothetical protein